MRQLPMTREIQACLDRWETLHSTPVMFDGTLASLENKATRKDEEDAIRRDMKLAIAERTRQWVLAHAPNYELSKHHHPDTNWSDVQRTVWHAECGCMVAHLWSVLDVNAPRKNQVEIPHACSKHAHLTDPVEHHETVLAHAMADAR